jgi:transcriptional regulator with XRE-family HTH domain
MGELIKNLGNKLRSLRTEKGYTQENMAELLQMSVSGYARIERGENTDIGLVKIEQIAQVFHIQPTELIQSASNYNHVENVNGTGSGIVTNNHIQLTNDEDLKLLKTLISDLTTRVQKLEEKK